MNKSLVTKTDCPQESKQLWEQQSNSCHYPLINCLIWKIAIDNEKIIWIRKIISNFHQPSNSIRKSLRQQDFDTLIKIATITTRFEALFVLEQAHHFGRFNFWISNNCCCFRHWKKSKQTFKIQHVQINELPRTLVLYGLWCFNVTYCQYDIGPFTSYFDRALKEPGLCSFYKHLLYVVDIERNKKCILGWKKPEKLQVFSAA